ILASHGAKFHRRILFPVLGTHAAEFDQINWFRELTEALGNIKHRPRIQNLLQYDEQQKERRKKYDEKYRADNIENLLHDSAPADKRRLADGNHRIAQEDIDGIFAGIKLGFARDETVADVVHLG